MNELTPSPRNLAARAGRWSAAHRKTALLGWLAFVIAATILGGAVGTREIPQLDQGAGDSGRAERVMHHSFKENLHEQVLVQSRHGRASDPDFKQAVADLISRLRATGTATHIQSPLERGNASQLSRDGRSARVFFEIKGTAGADPDAGQVEKVNPLLRATAATQRAHAGLRIEQFGEASASKAVDDAYRGDLKQAERLSLPVTLAILVFAFGALIAAGVPVLLAATGVAATLGLTEMVSQISPVDESISDVVVLIGMAVGVDYSLFYLRREREERAAGNSAEAALDAAAATSGRSVMISGLTVIAAMAGMHLTGDKAFASIGTGTMLAVAVAVLGSLTALPALLSMLGDRVMKARVPIVARRRERTAQSGLWSALLEPVLRHPRLAAIASAGALVALALPALGLHTGDPGAQGMPQNLPITHTLNRMETAFPGDQGPAVVVVQANDVRSPMIQDAIGKLERAALASGKFYRPDDVRLARSHRVAVLALPIAGNGTDRRSKEALELLRGRLIPATLGRTPGTRTIVSGLTASSEDYNRLLRAHAPLVFVFVLTMAFGLLMVTFRSIVIPLKAIALNLLSVGASYGVLVLVFQHGWGASLLGFKATGTIVSWLPIFLFVILFGLSMDYHIFIVSRVREAFDRGLPTDQAVAHGIKSTAGVVTSAAAVMIGVFSIFASLQALVFKQLGVGLAAAILIDATIVRAVLLPATMKLLGDWNWYLPKRLQWLPRIGTAPATEAGRA